MSFERAEHAKWVKLKQQPMAEHNLKVDAVLSDSAARGFQQPPGSMIDDIINIGQEVKLRLTEANGGLYKEQEEILFSLDEFALKLTVEYAKLELAIYKQGILDAITFEKAQIDHDRKIDQADITKQKAEINKRNVTLIKATADQEAEITGYRIRQEEAGRLGMDKLVDLLEAQKETAEERLKVIDALKAVITAEELIVEAENRKAEALERVIAAEEILLGIKQGMIPFYEDLAGQKKLQAQAVKAEAGWKKQIINLGYDRIELQKAETQSFVTQKETEVELEVARAEYITASVAVDEARSEASITLTEEKNLVADQIIPLKEQIGKDKVSLALDTSLERFTQNIEKIIDLQREQNMAITKNLNSELSKLAEIANSHRAQIEDCAETHTRIDTCTNRDTYIKGSK
jgi:hypothetical protein